MPFKPKNIVGMRFTKLVAIEDVGKDRYGSRLWRCVCDCGNETVVSTTNLISGNTKSCGCLRIPPRIIKHGGLIHGNKEKLYAIWNAMKNRCNNPNDPNYFRYGGRGIYVCEEWQKDYGAFRDWCYAHGYQKGLELDRENNNDGYTPENCRFVTHRENLLNTHRAKKYREVAQWS